MTFGNNMQLWEYARRIFVVLGSYSMLGYVYKRIGTGHASFFDANLIISSSSFFLLCSHAMILPLVQTVIMKLINEGSQLSMTIWYMSSPIITIVIVVSSYSFLNKTMPRIMLILTGNRQMKTK